MEQVDFLLGLGKWGDVRVIANASIGRQPPVPCSDVSLCDPGDPPEAELLDVISWDAHGVEVSLLRHLTPGEQEVCRMESVWECQRLAHNRGESP